MEKSRKLIKYSTRLICVVVLILIFLESDLFKENRYFLVSYFKLFSGKGEIISNIFIGILGSTILLDFGEIINYFQEKGELHLRILKLCQKWDREIKYIDKIGIEDMIGADYEKSKLLNFADEVEYVYKNYLPYIRVGMYYQYIRELFVYTHEIKIYLNQTEHRKNEISYWMRCIQDYQSLKTLLDNEITEKYIQYLKKELLYWENMKFDTAESIKKINKYRNLVKVNESRVCMLLKIYIWNSIEEKDEQYEFERQIYKSKELIRKNKWKLFRMKMKEYHPYYLWNDVKLKWSKFKKK